MRLQRFLFTLIDQCSVLVNQRIHNFGNVRPRRIIPARRSVVSYQTMSLIHMLLRIFSCRGILPSYRFLTNMLRIISISTHVNLQNLYSSPLAILQILGILLAIYATCTLLDFIRQALFAATIDRRRGHWFDLLWDKVSAWRCNQLNPLLDDSANTR